MSAPTTTPTMDLWRLERLRLTRTNRLWLLTGVYAFFGVLGPLTARYLREILTSVGGEQFRGMEIPDPVPADGITQFVSNASQLGLLAVVVVAAGALALDAKPEIGVFLRTRVRSTWRLLVPRAVTVTVAAVGALVVGTAIAALLTAALIGAVDAAPLVVGTLYGAVYLAFVVSLTAAVGARASGVLTTVLVSVGILIALPIAALFPQVERWVPSELVGAIDLLVRGAPLTDPLPAALTAVVASAGLLWLAARWLAAREL
jgi:ABC-2 type transport system permease protein